MTVPIPFGDPEGMRQLAQQLSTIAGALHGTSGRVNAAWSKAEGEGPWVDDLGFLVQADSKQFVSAAGKLKELSNTLNRAATTLEGEQSDARLHNAAVELQRARDAAEAARKNEC